MKGEKLTANEQTIVDLWNAKSISEVEKLLADYKKREAKETKLKFLKEVKTR